MKQSDVMTLPDGCYSAAPNLYLYVRGGSRLWVFRFYAAGRRVKRDIGRASTTTLAMARARALQIRAAIDAGKSIDEAVGGIPFRGWAAGRRGPAPVTWNAIAVQAIEHDTYVKGGKAGANTKAIKLQRNADYLAPAFGERALQDITRDDVLSVLRPMWRPQKDGGHPEMAKKVRGIIELVFTYARFKGLWNGANPAAWRGNLDQALPPLTRIHQTQHHHALSLEEAKTVAGKLWEQVSAAAHDSRFPFARASVLFGCLTATREVEFCLAKWGEIDLKTKTWSVDPSHRKGFTTAPLRVALSRQAVALLNAMPQGEADDFIFAGLRGGAMAKGSALIAIQKVSGKKTTMHGVRSTFKDWAEENGWDTKLTEAALSHKLAKSQTEAAYFRTDLLEQRRPLMQAWADAILPAASRRSK